MTPSASRTHAADDTVEAPFPRFFNRELSWLDFNQRVLARLLLLPPHDPQFRRNRERVVRDAERENLYLEWDLGLPEEESTTEAG